MYALIQIAFIQKFPCIERVFHSFIGRIIALPNENIKIKEGILYLNGQVAKENFASELTILPLRDSSIIEDQELRVPDGHFFVLMDNRPRSVNVDSRIFGPIPRKLIVGKVLQTPIIFLNFKSYSVHPRNAPTGNNVDGDDLYKAGLYFLNLKNTTKAEEYFTKAGTEYKDIRAFNELGNMAFEKKDYEKARGYYQNALEIEPENPNALHNMGYAYWNTGDTKNAEDYLKRALAAYEKVNNPDLKEGVENLRTFVKENGLLK